MTNRSPYLTHIQLVTAVMNALKQAGDSCTAAELDKAQHFEVDYGIYIAAGRFVWELTEGSELFVDSIAVPPANPATFRLGDENSIFLMRSAGQVVIVTQIGANGAIYREFRWQPGTNRINTRSTFEPQTEEVQFQLHLTALSLSMMLSLINSPKLVELTGRGQRQERRAANKSLRLPVKAWYKVVWRTAAGRKVAATDNDEYGAKMPLHYRRGHLRTAQSHFAAAFETTLTDTGWAQWIDGRWVGNPAFGVKKAVHAPVLDRHGLADFMNRKRQR